MHIKLQKLSVKLLLMHSFLYLSGCDHFPGITPPLDDGMSGEIIAPASVKSGESIPIVVRLLTSSAVINTKTTKEVQLHSEKACFGIDTFNVKKGVGSITTTVQAVDDFVISIEGMNSQKNICLLDTIPVVTHTGTISNHAIWQASQEHHITADLTVSQGGQLTIEKGTRIVIDSKVNVIVNGELEIKGDKENPVLVTCQNRDAPWGGFVINETDVSIEYCFFIHGGADDSRIFGHSNSQPVLLANNSDVSISNCFFLDNVGKALGVSRARIRIEKSLISRCDTGGEFHHSEVHVTGCHILDIPNDDGVFVDDDNDGFYFADVPSDPEVNSSVENTFIITGKDDAIDHNLARLEIRNCWLEGFMHEGVAGSNGNWVTVFNTVVKNCEQGIEAGYGSPDVTVDHCVVVDNDVGIRFGDSYDWGCEGTMTVTNTILFNNDDNIHNFDLLTQAPVDSAILISYSMTNDSEYDSSPFCITGTPLFTDDYFLKPGSPGKNQASDGLDMGLVKK
jgi:hypothetical protein